MSTTPSPTIAIFGTRQKRYRLKPTETRILESVSELRVNLAQYQEESKLCDMARIDWFAETHLDPLISDIADLKNGQPLKD